MSKNLAAKSRFSFSPAERFGCIIISEFTSGRKVRCHKWAVEKFWSNVLALGSVPKAAHLHRSSFMPFIPASADHATQVKALIEQHSGLMLSPLVGFFFPGKNFNLFGHEGAD